MTIFDYAKTGSSITTGTFFEHIMNPNGEGGSGGGEPYFVPFDGVECNLTTSVLSCDITYINCDLQIDELNAILSTEVYSADLDTNIPNGEIICQL